VTDQSSVTRFVEDNWLRGQRLGGGSFDAVAGKLENMFDFFQPFPSRRKLLLDEQTGQPTQQPSPWPWASLPHTPHG
jgi:phospholipase C